MYIVYKVLGSDPGRLSIYEKANMSVNFSGKKLESSSKGIVLSKI